VRLINRPLGLILAAALLAASVILIVEVIAFAAHTGPVLVHWTTWYQWAARTHWNRAVVRVWSIVLVAAGVLILALELKPARVTRLRLHSEDKATNAAMTRRGLAGALRAGALDIDGISRADVRVRRRRARVTATSAARSRPAASALKEPVTESVRQCLAGLDLRHPPRLTVRVVPRSR
jgi:Family of unknown function (DUF6286)